jgi:hypothetical protein
MTIEGSGFGTSATGSMPCCESVTVSEPPEPFCSRPLSPFVQGEGRSEGCFCPENVTVVDPADSSWNLLLSELRKLSAIVENGEQDYDASDTQRQTWSR